MRRLKAAVISGSSRPALRRRLSAVLIMLAILATLFALPAFAQTTYVITDGDNVIVHTTNSTDMREIILEAGLDLGVSDTYTTQETGGIPEIIINRVKMVTVDDGGQLSVLGVYGGTVSTVLDTLHITLGENDRISCAPDTEVYDGMSVAITRVEYETLAYDKVLPHQVLTYESDSLSGQENKILVPGADGRLHVTEQITYVNGQETSRTTLNMQVMEPAVDEIRLSSVDRSVKEQEGKGLQPQAVAMPTVKKNTVSTKSAPQEATPTVSPAEEGGTLTTASGATLKYSKILNCKATAYTCEGYTGYTYSGTVARVGAIAVDPKVIPLGTEMYIVADDGYCVYGYCVAEDTGGLIKGNRVDLYFDTYDECINFGYRPVTIYVLS